jgi:hypothetical protein
MLAQVVTLMALASPANSSPVDCSEAYGGESASCRIVACDERFQEMLGVWSGPFAAYDRATGGFVGYENTVSYTQDDCLERVDNGDRFIIGRRTDTYADKTLTGLLVTGERRDGSPFLRTVDGDGLSDYTLVLRDAAASLAIWRLDVETPDGPMTFTTIDMRDWTAPEGVHRRNVTVTMRFPAAGVDTVIVKGFHTNGGKA